MSKCSRFEEYLSKHGNVQIYKIMKINPRYMSHDRSHNTNLKLMLRYVNACSIKLLKCYIFTPNYPLSLVQWSLFLSPGLTTQSHWSNLGRGSKTLENTALINTKMIYLYILQHFEYTSKTRLTAGLSKFLHLCI